MKDKIKVTVTISYTDIAVCEDPKLCAKILAMVVEHEADSPPITPQQKLEDELRQQIEDLKSAAWSTKAELEKMRKAAHAVVVPEAKAS
jgi:hypothetical protein